MAFVVLGQFPLKSGCQPCSSPPSFGLGEMSRQSLCAMWARGHCNRGKRCQDRHHSNDPNEKIPCDCPEKSDAFPGGERWPCLSFVKSLLDNPQSFCICTSYSAVAKRSHHAGKHTEVASKTCLADSCAHFLFLSMSFLFRITWYSHSVRCLKG